MAIRWYKKYLLKSNYMEGITNAFSLANISIISPI